MSAVRKKSYEAVNFQGSDIILAQPYQALPEILVGWFRGLTSTTARVPPAVLQRPVAQEREFDARANFDIVSSRAFQPSEATIRASEAALARMAQRTALSDEEWADAISADLAKFGD